MQQSAGGAVAGTGETPGSQVARFRPRLHRKERRVICLGGGAVRYGEEADVLGVLWVAIYSKDAHLDALVGVGSDVGRDERLPFELLLNPTPGQLGKQVGGAEREVD